MQHWHSIITGGTKGIGRAITEERLKLGDTVTVVASTEKSIAEFQQWLGAHPNAPIYQPRTTVIAANLGSRDGIETVVKAVASVPREQLTLYCNAGVYFFDDAIIKRTPEEQKTLRYLNENSVRDLIGILMPARVVTTSSTAAHWEYPNGSWYHDTKRAAELFTISANAIGVDARVVCPGNTDTDVQGNFTNKPEDVMRVDDVGHIIATIHDTPYVSTMVIPVLGARNKETLAQRVLQTTITRDELFAGGHGMDELLATYTILAKERYEPLKPR
jgi:NAD(P)-dependent dehydrogenase (short-subunit alcohol dehydrogenase family)